MLVRETTAAFSEQEPGDWTEMANHFGVMIHQVEVSAAVADVWVSPRGVTREDCRIPSRRGAGSSPAGVKARQILGLEDAVRCAHTYLAGVGNFMRETFLEATQNGEDARKSAADLQEATGLSVSL